MKLQFKNQEFQEAATAAVCDVFEGQAYNDPNKYTVDPGKPQEVARTPVVATSAALPGFETTMQGVMDLHDEPDVGYKNAEIELTGEGLLANIHAIQDRQNLEHSTMRNTAAVKEKTLYPPLPELDVEMETGTGKTFVYIKTIFELNKRYGW